MAENALPYPTKTRLKLAAAIANRKVRHYPFHVPQTYNDITGNLVTSKVQFLLGACLVEVPEPTGGRNYAIVRLTPAGEEWSGFKNITEEGEGLEPGPVVCACGSDNCAGECPGVGACTCTPGHSTEDGAA